MPRNLKINNYMKHNKKTLIVPHDKNIFRLDMQDIISEISNYVQQEEKREEKREGKREEREEERMCRICFEGETDISNKLISPCLCKGTQKYIHNNCLKEWRLVNENIPEKRDKCEICNFHFVINNQQDYSIYKEDNSFFLIIIRHMLIIISSVIYGSIDYNYDFFTVKTLNFFSYYDCEILKYLKNMKNNSDSNQNNGYIILLYSVFIYSFVNFIYYLSLTVRTFYKRKELLDIEYITRVKILDICLKYQQSLFFLFYYIALIINDFNFFACLLPFICFINSFSYNLYIMKTNMIISELNSSIHEEIIYSFENNPMLGIELIEDLV